MTLLRPFLIYGFISCYYLCLFLSHCLSKYIQSRYRLSGTMYVCMGRELYCWQEGDTLDLYQWVWYQGSQLWFSVQVGILLCILDAMLLFFCLCLILSNQQYNNSSTNQTLSVYLNQIIYCFLTAIDTFNHVYLLSYILYSHKQYYVEHSRTYLKQQAISKLKLLFRLKQTSGEQQQHSLNSKHRYNVRKQRLYSEDTYIHDITIMRDQLKALSNYSPRKIKTHQVVFLKHHQFEKQHILKELTTAFEGKPVGDNSQPQYLQLSRLQGLQDHLQKIRQPQLHRHRLQGRKRTDCGGIHADLHTYFILDQIYIAWYISEFEKKIINKKLQMQKQLLNGREEKNKSDNNSLISTIL